MANNTKPNINWDHEIALALDRQESEEAVALAPPERTIIHQAPPTQVMRSVRIRTTTTTPPVRHTGPSQRYQGLQRESNIQSVDIGNILMSAAEEVQQRERLRLLTRPDFFRMLVEIDAFNNDATDGIDNDTTMDDVLFESFNFEQPRFRPAERAEFEALPTKTWRDVVQESEKKQGDKCCICLQEYQDDDKVIALQCKHILHQSCGKDWLMGTHRTCPLCRTPIDGGADDTASRSEEDSTDAVNMIAQAWRRIHRSRSQQQQRARSSQRRAPSTRGAPARRARVATPTRVGLEERQRAYYRVAHRRHR